MAGDVGLGKVEHHDARVMNPIERPEAVTNGPTVLLADPPLLHGGAETRVRCWNWNVPAWVVQCARRGEMAGDGLCYPPIVIDVGAENIVRSRRAHGIRCVALVPANGHCTGRRVLLLHRCGDR